MFELHILEVMALVLMGMGAGYVIAMIQNFNWPEDLGHDLGSLKTEPNRSRFIGYAKELKKGNELNDI